MTPTPRSSVPAGYFVAPDYHGDIWIWREGRDYPTLVLAAHSLRNDPELWDYLVSALPHKQDGAA